MPNTVLAVCVLEVRHCQVQCGADVFGDFNFDRESGGEFRGAFALRDLVWWCTGHVICPV